MIELLKKLESVENIDLNKQIKNYELDSKNALLISKYMVDNKKGIIREAYENKSKNTSYISEELKQVFENIRTKKIYRRNRR